MSQAATSSTPGMRSAVSTPAIPIPPAPITARPIRSEGATWPPGDSRGPFAGHHPPFAEESGRGGRGPRRSGGDGLDELPPTAGGCSGIGSWCFTHGLVRLKGADPRGRRAYGRGQTSGNRAASSRTCNTPNTPTAAATAVQVRERLPLAEPGHPSHHPEAAVVHPGGHHRTESDCGEEVGRVEGQRGRIGHQRGNDRRSGEDGDRPGALRELQQGGDPGGEQEEDEAVRGG